MQLTQCLELTYKIYVLALYSWIPVRQNSRRNKKGFLKNAFEYKKYINNNLETYWFWLLSHAGIGNKACYRFRSCIFYSKSLCLRLFIISHTLLLLLATPKTNYIQAWILLSTIIMVGLLLLCMCNLTHI